MFEKLRNAVGSVIDKLSKTELTPQNLEPLLWDLKIKLIENDVALSVADELCDELEATLTGAEIGHFEDKKNRVNTVFRQALQEVMQTPQNLDLFDLIEQKRRKHTPLILVFVGVMGQVKQRQSRSSRIALSSEVIQLSLLEVIHIALDQLNNWQAMLRIWGFELSSMLMVQTRQLLRLMR